MPRIASSALAMTAVLLATLGGSAISAPDKDSVKVPDGLALAEFGGYEDWQTMPSARPAR